MGEMKKEARIRMVRNRICRLLTFLPAVCMACLIFGFSAQTGEESSSLSRQVTEGLVWAVDQITGSGWTEEEVQEQAERYEIYVRKAAHMTEYAVFAVTVLLPLHGCGFRGRRLFLITALVCASFAAGDEWHQSFVGGRGPSAADVGIDFTGACIGMGAAGVFLRRRKKARGKG